jgi:site-specific recombinase XerD
LRAVVPHATAGKTWAEDPDTGKHRDLGREEHQAFWAFAAVEVLRHTGMRKGELANLTIDAVVQIGSAYWLRIPIGKLHNDRYIPLHPQLKELLGTWLANRPEDLRSKLMFTERGRPLSTARVDAAVAKVARAAGLQDVSPHRLRHTLATQAINRGMSLEAIAALLGHRSLSMTLVYANSQELHQTGEKLQVAC